MGWPNAQGACHLQAGRISYEGEDFANQRQETRGTAGVQAGPAMGQMARRSPPTKLAAGKRRRAGPQGSRISRARRPAHSPEARHSSRASCTRPCALMPLSSGDLEMMELCEILKECLVFVEFVGRRWLGSSCTGEV